MNLVKHNSWFGGNYISPETVVNSFRPNTRKALELIINNMSSLTNTSIITPEILDNSSTKRRMLSYLANKFQDLNILLIVGKSEFLINPDFIAPSKIDMVRLQWSSTLSLHKLRRLRKLNK